MVIVFDWPKDVPCSEYDQKFIQGMLDRMAMSYSTYGAVKDGFPDKIDALKSLSGRIHKYRTTGNTEWLMDVANFAMIEFMFPTIEGAHFKNTEAKESPGRHSWEKGMHTKDRNDE